LGRYLEGQGYSMTLKQNCFRPITWLFEVWFYNYYTKMITILSWRVAHNNWVATLKVKVTAWPWSKIVSGPYLRYLKSDFKNISQKWSPYWGDVSQARFGSLPWRSRSQHNRAAKLCLAYNFVIFIQILNLFHRNDHHIETPCCKQIRVPILKVKVTAWPCSKIVSRPQLCYLKSDFTTIWQKWSLYWDYVSLVCPLFGSVCAILQYTKYCYLNSKLMKGKASFSGLQEGGMCPFCTS